MALRCCFKFFLIHILFNLCLNFEDKFSKKKSTFSAQKYDDPTAFCGTLTSNMGRVELYGVILASVPPYLSLSTLAGLSCGWGIISTSGLIFTSCCFREIWLNRRHTFEFTIGAPRSYCQAQPSSIQNQLSWLG